MLCFVAQFHGNVVAAWKDSDSGLVFGWAFAMNTGGNPLHIGQYVEGGGVGAHCGRRCSMHEGLLAVLYIDSPSKVSIEHIYRRSRRCMVQADWQPQDEPYELGDRLVLMSLHGHPGNHRWGTCTVFATVSPPWPEWRRIWRRWTNHRSGLLIGWKEQFSCCRGKTTQAYP